MKGENFLDGISLEKEVIDDAIRHRNSCCMFQIDFEKAYNSVN